MRSGGLELWRSARFSSRPPDLQTSRPRASGLPSQRSTIRRDRRRSSTRPDIVRWILVRKTSTRIELDLLDLPAAEIECRGEGLVAAEPDVHRIGDDRRRRIEQLRVRHRANRGARRRELYLQYHRRRHLPILPHGYGRLRAARGDIL